MRHAPTAALGLLLTVFVGQGVVEKVTREPYPGLFQPAFGGDVPTGGIARTNEPRVTATYEDGSEAAFGVQEIMAQSKAQPLKIFLSAYGPKSPRAQDPDSVAWLAHRLEVLGTGREPVQAVIEFRDVDYALDESRPPVTTVTGRRVLDLRTAGG